jgi:hypothetical protein
MNLAALILIIFAMIMIMCGAIIIHFENKKRKNCSYEVMGTSKSLLRSHSPVQHNGIGSEYYTRVYEYQYYGYIYEAISRVSTTGVSNKIKQKKIYINPNNPQEYLIDHGLFVLIAAIPYGIGAILVIVAIALMF